MLLSYRTISNDIPLPFSLTEEGRDGLTSHNSKRQLFPGGSDLVYGAEDAPVKVGESHRHVPRVHAQHAS